MVFQILTRMISLSTGRKYPRTLPRLISHAGQILFVWTRVCVSGLARNGSIDGTDKIGRNNFPTAVEIRQVLVLSFKTQEKLFVSRCDALCKHGNMLLPEVK
jgi:hypothetical protein